MTPLQLKHRTLAITMLLVVAVAAIVWFVAVRPLRQAVRSGEDDVAERRRSLQKRGWPLQRDRLEGLLAQRKSMLEGDGHASPGLTARSEQVLYHATSMVRERIKRTFESDLSFVRNASNIDFREAFNALQRQAAGKNIWLSPEVLKLSEDTSSPYTYQMLLQVWTVERLLNLVLESGLLVAVDESVTVSSGGHRHAAANVSVQPLIAYYLSAASKQPYLLEIPVKLQLQGGIAEVRRFLGMLTAGEDFLPPMHLEIMSADPASEDAQTRDGVVVDTVTARLVCSAFFSFPTNISAEMKQKTTGQAGEPGV